MPAPTTRSACLQYPEHAAVDTVLKAGEGPYYKLGVTSKKSLGDYSATVVDPRMTSICGRYKNTRDARRDGREQWRRSLGHVVGQGCGAIGSIGGPRRRRDRLANPTPAGSNLTYTITVTKKRPECGDRSSVTDTLPSGVSFVRPRRSQGTCSGTSTVTCSLGTLGNLAAATVTLDRERRTVNECRQYGQRRLFLVRSRRGATIARRRVRP